MYDGIPNPAYNPAYGNKREAKASAFAPTLRMDLTEEKLREYEEIGITIESATEQLTELFRNVSVTSRVRFTAETVTVVETGEVLTKFQSGISATFEIDDVLHLKLDTGDVIAMKIYRA